MADDSEVLSFAAPPAPDRAADPTVKPIRFTLGDDPFIFTAIRPKSAILIQLSSIDEGDPMQLARAASQFINAVFDKESKDYLWGRLLDPEDDWDYDVLIPVIDTLKERWFKRPPGSRPGSAKQRRRSGPSSTARSRSTVSTPTT